ncbi:hypothetical protein ABH935_004679 [Catenulispora sp. GAS73]|uniref:hypothetical protein n=1 Tax=Catenulispora sp. GAS73 TaxID=3156269 RepID=UPI0035161C80
MEQQDELEIETRLRAALQARSELVTHSTLRPGIPPNEHTAGVRARRESWWSWRRMWVPVTVAAALAGGVFAGAQLPSSSSTTATGPASGGGSSSGPVNGSTAPMQEASTAGTPQSIGTLSVTVTSGWQFTSTSKTSACVTLSSRPAPAPATSAAALPCGVDALYLKTDATAATWPLSTAAKDTGWWPTAVSSASDIVCPAATSGSSTDMVKASMLLRFSDKYELAAQPGQATPATAEYHEWAVTCDTGPGVQPMLWKLNAAPGAAAPATFTVATVVSANPQYDSALLGMVGSLHQTS